jgi:hypothetical protein
MSLTGQRQAYEVSLSMSVVKIQRVGGFKLQVQQMIDSDKPHEINVPSQQGLLESGKRPLLSTFFNSPIWRSRAS